MPAVLTALILRAWAYEEVVVPQLNSVSATGNGCLTGGHLVEFAPYNPPDYYRIDLPNFNVYFGPSLNISATEQSRNCNLHLDVLIPHGYRVFVSGVLSYGFIDLWPEARAQFFTTVFWSPDAFGAVSGRPSCSSSLHVAVNYLIGTRNISIAT
jgi:hypothetical protein